MFYVVKFVAPVNLAVIYPRPRELGDVPAWLFHWSPLLLLLLGAAAYRGVRRSRPAMFGLLFFVITYLPVSQILPAALSIPADRYTYVPYVGLFFGLVSLVEPNLVDQGKARRTAVSSLLGLVLVLSWWSTFRRVKVWHDSMTLWQDSVAHQPVARAYHHLGWTYLADRGDLDRALALFSEATARDPRLAVAWLDRGVVLARQGHYEQAIVSYGEAEKIEPAFIVYTNRANAYLAVGFPRAAIQDCSTALRLRPTDADAWYFRGTAYLLVQERDRAIADFTQALKLRDTFKVRNVRGNAYEAAGELPKALDDFNTAIELEPGSPDGYYNRARIYSKTGRPADAVSDALKAKALGMKISDEELARLRR
jgi:Flp pilus assembly protein TadD